MTWLHLSMLGNVVTSVMIAVAGIVAAVAYQMRAPWRSSATGRHVMAMTVTITAYGAYTVAIWLWPHGVVAGILRSFRILIGLGMTALLIQRAWFFLRGPDNRRDGED